MKRKLCALTLLCALLLTLLPLIPQAAAITEVGLTTLYIEPTKRPVFPTGSIPSATPTTS